MKVLDIRQLIGEATEYDKKVALEVKKPKSWCKSVSAFSNGMGGRIIWGIADDDTLVGLADAKGDAEKISEAIKVHIDPIPEFNLSFAKAEDKEFVVLTVMPGAQTPYYYIGDGQDAGIRSRGQRECSGKYVEAQGTGAEGQQHVV